MTNHNRVKTELRLKNVGVYTTVNLYGCHLYFSKKVIKLN